LVIFSGLGILYQEKSGNPGSYIHKSLCCQRSLDAPKRMAVNGEVKLSRPHSGQRTSEVDVMIIIFCEKIGAFLKKQCYDQNFAKFSFILRKNVYFLLNFSAKIFLKS
jgi:hypothetical protein